MKLLVVLATLLVSTLALTDQQRENLDKHVKPCKEKHEVPEPVSTENEEPDPRLKSGYLCVFKRLGLANEGGEINNDALKVRIKAATSTEEEAETVFKKCVVKKTTQEDTVYKATRCLYKELPDFSPVE